MCFLSGVSPRSPVASVNAYKELFILVSIFAINKQMFQIQVQQRVKRSPRASKWRKHTSIEWAWIGWAGWRTDGRKDGCNASQRLICLWFFHCQTPFGLLRLHHVMRLGDFTLMIVKLQQITVNFSIKCNKTMCNCGHEFTLSVWHILFIN